VTGVESTVAGGAGARLRGSVRVKICGVCSVDDALAAVAAGADMIGLNFFRAGKRFVDRERAAEIAAAVPPAVWRVGVFVNASRDEIESTRRAVGLTAIQLHGDEPPELVRGWPVPVIRAARLTCARDAEAALDAVAPDYFLAEGVVPGAYGGARALFDWAWASPLPAERLFLAGGLTPDNVADAVRRLRPFAVDVASGVERAPRVKEPALMAAFVEHAKAA